MVTTAERDLRNKIAKGRKKQSVHTHCEELTPKQAQFCNEYIIDYNGARAAREVGVSEKAASSVASQWLDETKYPLVSREIKRLCDRKKSQASIEQWRVVEELILIALFDPRRLVNKDTGAILSLREMSRDVASVIHEIEAVTTVREFTNPVTGQKTTTTQTTTNVKFYSKLEALKMLAQHLELKELTDQYMRMMKALEENNAKSPISQQITSVVQIPPEIPGDSPAHISNDKDGENPLDISSLQEVEQVHQIIEPEVEIKPGNCEPLYE